MESTEGALQNYSLSLQVLITPGRGYITVDQLDSPFEDDDNQLYSRTLCCKTFTLPSSLRKHERLRHGSTNHNSFKCKRNIEKLKSLKRHILVHDKDNESNSRNKRQRQSSSQQPGPFGL
ncbi:hypothetical protein AVEN_184005-1 [Araneus ventricosus]|uniref:C2H2-type domain-containing protein n=1 Tax=Araneus ventricosus TaxID=182803 RepID=A0A4Y2E0A3_ARAVE|nr:hypothetical protein AVEN_184005-1 [Araneus ventricosus]